MRTDMAFKLHDHNATLLVCTLCPECGERLSFAASKIFAVIDDNNAITDFTFQGWTCAKHPDITPTFRVVDNNVTTDTDS